ncbi:oxidoreductase [Candidatus Woesearchaeota archaeon]|jgi:sulfhydrogenase subunit delta|nr:oxidoreductase [Candidatus Woesearchaeota archaeon]
MVKNKKLKIGIFSFTSCAGCQFEILDLEDELLDLFTKANIAHFPMAKAENDEGDFDVAFVEGAITTKKEAIEVRKIRKKTKYVVALGTCASYGGVPSIKDFYTEEEIEVPVYKSTKVIKSIRADGIANYVKVDYFMHGCPPNKYEFLHVMKELMVGKTPRQPDYPVCKECRENKNPCLLQQGKACMGPITNGGCDSVCTNCGIPCKGCRGPIEDANIDRIVKLYEKMGFSNEDIKRFFRGYAGTSKIFAKVVGQTCDIRQRKLGKTTKTTKKSAKSTTKSKKSKKRRKK